MPVATVHLVALTASTSLKTFLEIVGVSALQPLVVSRVIRWIITPTTIDRATLVQPAKPWDLLLIVLGDEPLPEQLQQQVACHWSTAAGIPSRLTRDFAATNAALLHPDQASVPALTGALDQPRLGQSSQTLELSADLASWVESFAGTHAGQSPLSMLNLLAFQTGRKASYLQYGKAFAESIGRRRGGHAKLVGNIVAQRPPEQSGGRWDEFALASYPSIRHFADMLASQDYQAVNLEYRVPALADTFILCTSEIEIERAMAGPRETKTGARTMGKL